MSIVEGLICIACTRWIWKRCTYTGADDSATWSLSTIDGFEPIPRICRVILAVYRMDRKSQADGPNHHQRLSLNPDWVVKRATYHQTQGRVPPYMIYVDHDNKEIILAVRGLNLVKDSDYRLLLDNRLGMQKLDGGYVHHGLLKSAIWLLKEECETLRKVWLDTGGNYKMVFAGHSLGSGVAALMAVVAANYGERLGGVPRSSVRCYAVAPARCVSLDLAVKYADVIHSVVLQDDFLPRTPTPLEDIFKSIFCFPCLLSMLCWKDTIRSFGPLCKKQKDQRKLYVPGRVYHIVERKLCSCGKLPPEVRTAVSADAGFEHIILSCNATSDHSIFWIERQAERALQTMGNSSTNTITTAPTIERIQRAQSIENEYKEEAVILNVPYAATPQQEEKEEGSSKKSETSSTNWDDLVEKLFTRNLSGDLLRDNDAAR